MLDCWTYKEINRQYGADLFQAQYSLRQFLFCFSLQVLAFAPFCGFQRYKQLPISIHFFKNALKRRNECFPDWSLFFDKLHFSEIC